MFRAKRPPWGRAKDSKISTQPDGSILCRNMLFRVIELLFFDWIYHSSDYQKAQWERILLKFQKLFFWLWFKFDFTDKGTSTETFWKFVRKQIKATC